ncbi:Divalent metal cation (Fe/Co/Zn/Cd) transporter [Geosmithia morbida]|uniref:Divalent metal cation (Fe/Co/Zn/Cd) transporter n=1 Tax=Geosmithia morbida TaxID=1094350 RepID=A0A9P5D4U7_9HYPO|nr:Divalent metal cation (Fe/Co/Zn/Cd) transporter [Geosmithia morbida]KAF4123125.1 Divalent metal cation (Fe/Co/Zn/Cd) transporter [Geosmithia morbida]
MGQANQTRDSVDDHRLRKTATATKAELEHDHDHDHDRDHDDPLDDHHHHGHSHGLGGHHHHHDTTFLVSKNRNDPGVRITNIGLMSNLAMAAVKFIAGWAFNSKAMAADGWHSLTDLASDVLTLATVSFSLRSPSERFPLGFGKVESLGALGVSGMLLVGGCYMGWDSAITLYGHFSPETAHAILAHVGHGHGHGHSHGAAALGIPSIHAAWVAGGTVLVKEWLYHATMKVARERRSSVLASNAVHHRVDSLTGIVTLVAILGANVIESAAWLDPVGGLIISSMVIHAGAVNMVDALCELADQSIDEDVKISVEKKARAAIAEFDPAGETQLRDVSGIKSGQNFMMDLEVSAPGTWNIDHAREMESAIRQRVGTDVRGVRRVRVRFVSHHEPIYNKFDEFIMDQPESTEDKGKEDSKKSN